jgi:hypothetical protein
MPNESCYEEFLLAFRACVAESGFDALAARDVFQRFRPAIEEQPFPLWLSEKIVSTLKGNRDPRSHNRHVDCFCILAALLWSEAATLQGASLVPVAVAADEVLTFEVRAGAAQFFHLHACATYAAHRSDEDLRIIDRHRDTILDPAFAAHLRKLAEVLDNGMRAEGIFHGEKGGYLWLAEQLRTAARREPAFTEAAAAARSGAEHLIRCEAHLVMQEVDGVVHDVLKSIGQPRAAPPIFTTFDTFHELAFQLQDASDENQSKLLERFRPMFLDADFPRFVEVQTALMLQSGAQEATDYWGRMCFHVAAALLTGQDDPVLASALEVLLGPIRAILPQEAALLNLGVRRPFDPSPVEGARTTPTDTASRIRPNGHRGAPLSVEGDSAMKDATVDKVAAHLEFLGYELERRETSIYASHPTKPNYLLSEFMDGVMHRTFWPANERAQDDRLGYLEFVNRLNHNASVTRYYADRDGDLVVEAWYPESYDRARYARFYDGMNSDFGRFVLSPEGETYFTSAS